MKNVMFIGAALIFSLGCEENAELKRSVFIHDPAAPGLPKYSEWGYNTFGAYYEREVIVSNDFQIPARIIRTGDVTTFEMRGQKGQYNYWSETPFTISVTIPEFDPASFEDLVVLDNSIIDLSGDGVITFEDAYGTHFTEVLEGAFEFRRAQRLLVDGKAEEVILSGVFAFQALIDGEPVSVTEGRFDVGIGEYNFFRY